MAKLPIRSASSTGDWTEMSNPAPEADVFPSLFRVKSASRLKPQPVHNTPPYSHLQKSFSEAVANSTADRSKNLQPTDLRKYLLADHIPQPIGAKSLIKGCPTLTFVDAETEELAASYHFFLFEKFSHGAPSYSQMHLLIARLGIQEAFTMSMINSKHTLISLSSESYYSRLWLRCIWFLRGYPMRIFKWMPTFTPAQESLISIWEQS